MAGTLITGANGQLGNELRVISEQLPSPIYFTDIAELDICDSKAVQSFVNRNNIDTIINCAAYTAVDKAEDEPALVSKINAGAPGILAAAAASAGALLIHVSTDYVFDGKGPKPYKESDITGPVSVYGLTKLEGEKNIERSGCRYIIIRTAWLYSAFGNNFAKTILRLAKEKDSINVVFDQVGTPTYAADLASAIVKIVGCKDDQYSRKNNENKIYHFSNEGVCSWYDFALEIVQKTGLKTCRIMPVTSDKFPSKAVRPSFSVLDKGLIKSTYNMEIPHWREALDRCMQILNK
jgi:dTDP-4-dehydrorhamnose reductase